MAMNILNNVVSGLLVLSTFLGIPAVKGAQKPVDVTITRTDAIEDSQDVKYTTVRSKDSSAPDEDGTYTATLMAVGDNLIHEQIYNWALQEDGTYDFSPIFENLHDQIQGADIAVINQETILIDDRSRIASYPDFGTPIEMSDAISDAGFNVVLHASNHTMDRGVRGIYDTLSVWKNYFPDVTLLGINDSEEEANEIRVVEKNNISFAMLNYTYGLNGAQPPADKKYLLNTLDDEEKVLNDVDRAEDMADVTVCFLHIGQEYSHTPTAYQKSWIEKVIDHGADIVICAHPHVLQPYDAVTTDAGNQGVVFYSLGNFMSAQSTPAKVLGGMANITVKKHVTDEGSSIEISDYSMTALVTHQEDRQHYTVYRLCDYDDDLARKSVTYSRDPSFSCDKLWNLYSNILAGKAEDEK